MYKIIGADQNEYGPVSAEQILEWMDEGRVNGETLVQAEGSADWRPLSSYPELSRDHEPAARAEVPEISFSTDPEMLAAQVRQRGYEIDIGFCFSRSWALLTQNLGLLVGATFIFLAIIFLVNGLLGRITGPAMQRLIEGEVTLNTILLIILTNVPEIILYTVLSAGLYWILLKLIRGEEAQMGDLFAGFSRAFVPLALAGLATQILAMLGVLACILPGIYLSVAWILTVPLVIDKGYGFWEAMELSRKVVTHNWWMMFVLVVAVGLVSLLGLLACCLGLLFTFPLGLGALMYAYEDIFRGPGSGAR
jgi:uncharacterized membrane protein